MINLGFLAALGAALAWGTYMVPFKKSGSSDLIQYQAITVVGIGFSGLVFSFLLNLPLNLNVYALFSGFLWTVANSVSLIAVVQLGIARATPLVSSIMIVASFFWGAFVFREVSGIFTGFIALILIILGVALVSMSGQTNSINAKKGLLGGILAGFIFGCQLVPVKVMKLSVQEFFFPLCLGIFLTGIILFIFKKAKFTNKAVKEGLLSGVIWNSGNLLSLISLSLIGLAKMGPISQLSVLVAVLWGLFYFKEITKPKAKLQVLLGALIMIAGVITLSKA